MPIALYLGDVEVHPIQDTAGPRGRARDPGMWLQVSLTELAQKFEGSGDARELVLLERPQKDGWQWPVNMCASLLSDGSALGGCSHPEPTPP